MAETKALVRLDDGASPGTHALVIGIGEYPNLLGGESPSPKSDGMGQLSSPPISARAFASWMLRKYRCPGKSLASLSLLLSEQDPSPFEDPSTGASHTVPSATIENIEAAVTQWKALGDSSTENRLVFYFCGHGVSQAEDMALLASDFSPENNNPLNQALDFRRLRNGLKMCQASEQLFFIDACRASSDILISQSPNPFAGRVPLLEGQRSRDIPHLLSVPYYATLAGERAFARHNSVSLFTRALLRGFSGAGSDNPWGEQDWRVTTSTLSRSIDDFMKRPVLAGKAVNVQTPTVKELVDFELHHLPDCPLVPVYVTCFPAEENATTDFICRKEGQEKLRRARGDVNPDDAAAEWYLELDFGQYQFDAIVAANDLRTLTRNVRPPFSLVKLEKAQP